MEKLRVYYDREGNALSVWFDDPKNESVCEEADDEPQVATGLQAAVTRLTRVTHSSGGSCVPIFLIVSRRAVVETGAKGCELQLRHSR
jgi:hypothetical protein